MFDPFWFSVERVKRLLQLGNQFCELVISNFTQFLPKKLALIEGEIVLN